MATKEEKMGGYTYWGIPCVATYLDVDRESENDVQREGRKRNDAKYVLPVSASLRAESSLCDSVSEYYDDLTVSPSASPSSSGSFLYP